MTEVLFLLATPESQRRRYVDGLRRAFPELVVNAVEHHGKVGPYIDTADVLMTFGPMLVDSVLAAAGRLKWIQGLGSGVDGIIDQPSLKADVIVTKVHGIHGAPMSEAAISAMLSLARSTPRVHANQVERTWERFPARTLSGSSVTIVGIGAIAETLAPLCKAFGMHVTGVTSTPREVGGFDRVVGRGGLSDAASQTDFLVLLTPSRADTKHLVDAGLLAVMKLSSFVINLARGDVIDDAALIDALERRAIAGAALDVFHAEPLPPSHPYWRLPNVIVTPHLGGLFEGYPESALPIALTNMRFFLSGDTNRMINLVSRP